MSGHGFADLRAAVARLYEDAGLPAPVILEGCGGVTKATIGGVRVYLAEDGKVGIGDEHVPPALARQIARMLVSVADAAENGLDPARVEELARVIAADDLRSEPSELDRRYATLALRWMRGREAAP